MEYFVQFNNRQLGPLTKEQLQELNITPDTPVWYEGLSDWMPAAQAPETAFLFTPGTPPPFEGNAQAQQPFTQGAYARQMYNQPEAPRCPDNYLVWAILATLLCCLPFGIVAIIKATSVNDKYNRGDYEGAEQASRQAKNWSIAAAVSGFVFGLIYIVGVAIMGMAGAMI